MNDFTIDYVKQHTNTRVLTNNIPIKNLGVSSNSLKSVNYYYTTFNKMDLSNRFTFVIIFILYLHTYTVVFVNTNELKVVILHNTQCRAGSRQDCSV